MRLVIGLVIIAFFTRNQEKTLIFGNSLGKTMPAPGQPTPLAQKSGALKDPARIPNNYETIILLPYKKR